MRRLVIGEVGRFPELGAALYAGGPGRAIASLAPIFERLADRGALPVHDPLLAATQFNWLIMSRLSTARCCSATAPSRVRKSFESTRGKVCACFSRRTPDDGIRMVFPRPSLI